MNNIFNLFGRLFTPKSYSQKLFTGCETHALIIANDDINLMEYIVEEFINIFGITEAQAGELMMTIHHRGIAVVWTGNSSEAQEYLLKLRKAEIRSFVTSIE